MEKEETFAVLVGMQTSAGTVENSMEVPQKVKNRTILGCSNHTTGYLPSKYKSINSKGCRHPLMFIEALFTTAKLGKQPKCPLIG